MSTARSALAHALREARQVTGLTQEELGRHLGLNGRAIYRWERDDARPSFDNQRRVVEVIAALHEEAGAKLRRAVAHAYRSPVAADMPAAPPPTAAPVVAPRALIERGVFTMADQLNLPAGTLRVALSRWLQGVRAANLPLDLVQHELDAWIGDAQ